LHPRNSGLIGQLAPDFTLADQYGNPFTLSEFRGRNAVVLNFYVLDNTLG
jgi:peroxiredoxin Q/BCP